MGNPTRNQSQETFYTMSKKSRVKKLEKTMTFWKGFASGVVSTLAGLAGLICLINYLVQITQAVK